MQRADFDKLSETGKHRAITEAELRAEEAEEKLETVWRHLFGAIIAAQKPDAIIASVMKYAEKLDKQVQKEYNENK